MPVSVMETAEIQKVQKAMDMEELVKSPKTIVDFFKTPEKQVLSKQKSLLQFFTKTATDKNSKLVTVTEKENADTSVGNACSVLNKCSSSAEEVTETLSSSKKETVKMIKAQKSDSKSDKNAKAKNEKLKEKLKKKQKVKMQKTDRNRKSEECGQTVSTSAEQNSVLDESENSVVLISDLSTCDEDLVKCPSQDDSVKAESLVRNYDVDNGQNNDNVTKISMSLSDTSKTEQRTEDSSVDKANEQQLFCMDQPTNDSENTDKKNSEPCAEPDQTEQMSNKFSLPNSKAILRKKTTLRGKDMLNLLKEIKDADVTDGKKSKHKHKHRHRHKEKTKQEGKQRSCRDDLRKMVAEKLKQELEEETQLGFTSIKNESKLTEKIRKKKLKHKGKGSNLVCVSESEISEGTNIPTHSTITADGNSLTTDLTEKTSTGEKNNALKDEIRNNSQSVTVDNTEYNKERKPEAKELNSCSSETAVLNDSTENKEDKEVKSISYEDFLRNLEEKEEKNSSVEVVAMNDEKEISYSECFQNSEEKVSSYKEDLCKESKDDAYVNADTFIEPSISKYLHENTSENTKSNSFQKRRKKEEDFNSDTFTEPKHTGIARFFQVVTSTPDKPEKGGSEVNQQLSCSKQANKSTKKTKLSKKKEDSVSDDIVVQKLDNVQCDIKRDIPESENSVEIITGVDKDLAVDLSNDEEKSVVEKDWDKNEDTKSMEEAQRRKQIFLNSKSSNISSGKTTQAVLSFGKSGLIMARNDADVKSDDTSMPEANCSTKKKSLKTGKQPKKQKVAKNENIEEQILDESHIFETPKNKIRKKKNKVNETVESKKSESDQSYEGNQSEESRDGLRRSSRRKYKVTGFEMDEDKRTPIKMKLRLAKSSSSLEETETAVTKNKIKMTAKQSKAQALLEKAKKGTKKTKTNPEKIEKRKKKEDKKMKKKSKKQREKDLDSDVVEHRRSSRLVGKTMPSMEEVSLENIVILSDEEQEADEIIKKKRKEKKKEKLQKNKDNAQEVAVGNDSPKPKSKKTGSPRKPAGKLAPIFMGKGTKGEEVKKAPLDPELAKQRMQFLMSGVPDELKKQSAKTVAAAVIATDYPPLPTVSHVLQIPELERCEGITDVWQLQNVDLNYRQHTESFYIEPVSRFTGDLINRQMANVDFTLIKNFSQHSPIEGTAEEACVGEVSCYNPGFPARKVFSALKKLKNTAELTQQETDKTDVSQPEPEVITLVDDEPEKKKRGRRSRLKLDKEEKKEVKQDDQPTPAIESVKKPVNSLLWTDKYQPSCSAELIGNSGSMKKMKNWLSEWKHVLDREAKKARKLLMKKNKGKLQKTEVADDQWDDDSDFDMDSDDSDIEDTLCNTMLITGPHGCGKTAAVYALAQELGFKVHEVNASSSRNGKRILSQLQEATQSHQVSHQGCGTPSKNPGTPSSSKPPAAPMPTAFTNLFKKKDTKIEEVIQIDDKKSKKRKREGNDEESPKKKRSKKTDKKGKTKMLKPTFLDVDESSNGMIQGLNLSSTTMILFDEVDVVFEDDKGFLSAVQTFMATTKIPIVMTTTSSSFIAGFDGRFETLTFKHPTVGSLCGYLQLICLLEGLRVNPVILSELLQLFKCDVRKCLLTLQFLVESGGALIQTFRSVTKANTLETSVKVPQMEETIENSQDSQDSTKGGYNPTFGDNDDDDFVMLKPRGNRQRRLIEDENSNSVDGFAQIFNQKPSELVPTTIQDEDAKLYPCVHDLGVESIVGLSRGQGGSLHDVFLRNMKMPTITNLLETCQICEVCQIFCRHLLSNNLTLLLPLINRVTDNVITVDKDNHCDRKGKKRKRIQTDLYDSEASNDAADCADEEKISDTKNETDEKPIETPSYNVGESRCTAKALSAFSRFYDTMGLLDVIESQESFKLRNSIKTSCGKRTYGSLQPGLDNELPKFQDFSELDCEVSRCYSTELEARSVSRMYQEIDRLQGDIEQLRSNNPAYTEEYILPVVRGKEKFSLVDRSQPSPLSGEKRAEENIVQNLPLVVHNHHRSLQLDYLPTLRDISRMEHIRQISNTKRRFHHYFDSITLPLKDTTLNILTSTFS